MPPFSEVPKQQLIYFSILRRQREPSDASFDASSQEDDDDREQYSVGVTENEETKVMNVVVRDGGTTDVLCDLVIRNERGGDIDDNCDLVITSVQSVQEQCIFFYKKFHPMLLCDELEERTERLLTNFKIQKDFTSARE